MCTNLVFGFLFIPIKHIQTHREYRVQLAVHRVTGGFQTLNPPHPHVTRFSVDVLTFSQMSDKKGFRVTSTTRIFPWLRLQTDRTMYENRIVKLWTMENKDVNTIQTSTSSDVICVFALYVIPHLVMVW